MATHELDPRLYGIAPREADVHNGEVMWTIEGVALYVGCSPDTIRRTPALMALRKAISPRVYRWIPDDVRAYMKALGHPPTPVALVKALTPTKQERVRKTLQRRVRQQQERAYDAALGWEPPVVPRSRRRKR